MEQWKVNLMIELIGKAKKILPLEKYMQGRINQERKNLGSLYKQMANIGNGFPNSDITYSMNVPKTLNRKKDDGCPACVKSYVMRENIKDAIKFINSYAKTLQKAVNDSGGSASKISVHDLKPTDND